MMPEEVDIADLRVIIKAVLNTVTQTTFSANEVHNLYKDQAGENIPFGKCGFSTLQQFLVAIDPASFSLIGNQIVYQRRANEKSAHIVDMIGQQKGAVGGIVGSRRRRGGAGRMKKSTSNVDLASSSQKQEKLGGIPESFQANLRGLVNKFAQNGITYEDFKLRFDEIRSGTVKPFHTMGMTPIVFFRLMPDVCTVRGTKDSFWIYPVKQASPRLNGTAEPLRASTSQLNSLPIPSISTEPGRRVTINDLIHALRSTDKILAGQTISLDEYLHSLQKNHGIKVVRFFEGKYKTDGDMKNFIVSQSGGLHSVSLCIDGRLRIDRAPDDSCASSVDADEKTYVPLQDPPFTDAYRTLPLLQSSNVVGVAISDFEDPMEFFITRVQDDNDRKTLLADLKRTYTPLRFISPPLVYKGLPCIVSYDGEDDFHRAVVRAVHKDTDPHSATVYYVDFGTEEDVYFHVIRQIDRKHLEAPVFAYRCQLFGLEPTDGQLTYPSVVLDRMESIAFSCGVLSAEIGEYRRRNRRYEVHIDTLREMFTAEGLAQVNSMPSSSNISEVKEKILENVAEDKWQRRCFLDVKMLCNGNSLWIVKTRRGLYVPTGCMAAMLNMAKDVVLEELLKFKISPLEIMELGAGDESDEVIRQELSQSNCPLIEDKHGRLYPTISLVPAVCVPHLLKILPGDFPGRKAVCSHIQELIRI